MRTSTARRWSNKGYGDAGASHRKRSVKGFKAQSGSAREDIDFNNYTMRQRARMLYMAAPLATSAVKTNRTNVIGSGLILSAKVDRDILHMTPEQADAWQRKTEKEFSLWADNRTACDALGLNDFYEIQQLALMSWLLSGDVFCLFKTGKTTPVNPYSLRLHIIEADRIATPTSWQASMRLTEGKNPDNNNPIYDGVEADSSGRVLAYHIRSTYPYEITDKETTWERIEAIGKETGMPNILQIMEAERPDQYRGVSYLAGVIEPLLQLRRYTETEITAAMIESCFAGFIKTTADPNEMPMNETEPRDPEERHSNPDDFNYGPGEVNVLKPGEDITFTDAKRPASGFAAFVRAIAEQVGAALEIPADLLMKAFNASYSASRGALLEAWKAFRMRRVWFAKDFCKPVYEAWLAEAVALGRINAPGFFADPLICKAYSGSEWTGPSQGQLDPVKEITAEILAVQHGFSTHEQSTARLNGGSWSNNVETLRRENAELAQILQGGTNA